VRALSAYVGESVTSSELASRGALTHNPDGALVHLLSSANDGLDARDHMKDVEHAHVTGQLSVPKTAPPDCGGDDEGNRAGKPNS
jgi:hypothetical protein